MSSKQARIAIGYVRVSTLGQVEEGVSLEAQREKIHAWCSLHNVTLLSIHADEGVSGKRADNRPHLQSALAEVCKRRGVLVVYSLSRLCRSTADALAIAQRLDRAGADLSSISESLDTSTSMGRFFYTLMASLAQLERDVTSERTTTALAHLRRQHRRISRIVPYGYMLDDDGSTLVPVEDEQMVIRRMTTLRQSGLGYRAIADRLNRDGIPAKAGGAWGFTSVKSVLDRQAKLRTC